MITPMLTAQLWFPLILRMCVDYPCLLPQCHNLVNPITNSRIPMDNLKLVAWHIAGNPSQSRAFQLKLVKELLSASCRHRTHKNYDSAWRKWERWCADANTSPIRSSLNNVLSFLTHQFQMGLSYRSVNLYRSAISSIHPKIDGFTVGTHPFVTR